MFMIKGVEIVAFHKEGEQDALGLKKLVDMAITSLLFSVTFLLNFHLFVKNKIALLIESEILEKMFLMSVESIQEFVNLNKKNFTFIFIDPVE